MSCPYCAPLPSPRAALERGREDVLRELGRLPTLEDLFVTTTREALSPASLARYERAAARLEARRQELVEQCQRFDDAIRRLPHEPEPRPLTHR